jgi:hypothetical protein
MRMYEAGMVCNATIQVHFVENRPSGLKIKRVGTHPRTDREHTHTLSQT